MREVFDIQRIRRREVRIIDGREAVLVLVHLGTVCQGELFFSQKIMLEHDRKPETFGALFCQACDVFGQIAIRSDMSTLEKAEIPNRSIADRLHLVDSPQSLTHAIGT